MNSFELPKNRRARRSNIGKSKANMVAALASLKTDHSGKEIFRLPSKIKDWPEYKSNFLAHAGEKEFADVLTGDAEEIDDLDPHVAHAFEVEKDHRKRVENETKILMLLGHF